MLKVVLLGGMRHGKLAVRQEARQISGDQNTGLKMTTHTKDRTNLGVGQTGKLNRNGTRLLFI
jgi:hypothetical protein